MDRAPSEAVARIAFKAAAELTLLIPLIKDYATNEEEYEFLRQSLTFVARKVNDDILEKIFSEYPDIEAIFDQSIKDYGRLP